MIDRFDIMTKWLHLNSLDEKCGESDNRSVEERIQYNERNVDQTEAFIDALSSGHITKARFLASEYDWESDHIDALLRWWFNNQV